jgi:hypothetical protein
MTRPSLRCLTAFLLGGCATISHQQAYYVSPFNGNLGDYQPLPLHADSAHTAVYARGAYFSGGANDNNTDAFEGGSLAVSVAHQFSVLQCYYGLGLSLGDYKVGKWGSEFTGLLGPNVVYMPPPNYQQLDSLSGNRSFGGASFSGGINLVIPFGDGSEWRVLGIETHLQHEFGDYLAFRNKLPDSLATLIVRNPFFGTVGLTTEIVARVGNGDLGFRLSNGWMLCADYLNLNIYDSVDQRLLRYAYIDCAVHYTYRQFTAFFQTERGTKAGSAHMGFVYRFRRPRLKR